MPTKKTATKKPARHKVAMAKNRRRAMAPRMGAPGEGAADAREAAQHERAKMISHGVALIRAGETFAFAAEKSGIPSSTLNAHYQKLLGPKARNREEARRDSESRIEAVSSAVAEGSFASMARDIQVDATTPFLEPKDKAMYSQAASRSLERLRGRQNPLDGNDSAGWGDWLSRLQEGGGGSVKIEVETQKPVIDVTPAREPQDR